MNKYLTALALLSCATLTVQSADMQDAIKQVKRNNFEKAMSIRAKLSKGADGPTQLMGEISEMLMLNNKKYQGYNPLKAYNLYNKVIYSDYLYNQKVRNVLREEGITMDNVRQDIENALMNKAKEKNTMEAYDEIIKACQGCSYLAEAQKAKQDLEFNKSFSGASLSEIQQFIDNNPDSPKMDDAVRMRDSLAYVKLPKSSDAYAKYISDYPNSKWTPELKKKVEKLAYDETVEEASMNAYAKYIANYPGSKHAKTFQAEIDKLQKELVWKIDPKYSDVKYVTDSVAKTDYILVKDGYWGVLNSTGGSIVSPKFEDVGEVCNGLLVARMGGKWGLANVKTGEMTYPANMDQKSDVKFLAPKFTAVKENGMWGLVYNGKDLIFTPFVTKGMSEWTYKKMQNGGIAMSSGTQLKIADGSGAVVLDTTYDEVIWRVSNDLDSRFIKVRNGKKYGIVSPQGKPMTDVKFDMMPFFDADGICILKDLFTEGWMDTTGHYLYYDRLSSYKDCGGNEKMISYEVNGKYGFIDKKQQANIPLKYGEVKECFENGVAKVRVGQQLQYIDHSGNVIVSSPVSGSASMKQNDGVILVKNGSKASFYNAQGQQFDVSGYDYIDSERASGMYIVSRGGKRGAIDPAGQVKIPLEYASLGRFCKDYSIARNADGRYGLYYKTQLALEMKYDKIDDLGFFLTGDCSAFDKAENNAVIYVGVNGSDGDERVVLYKGKKLFSTADEVNIVRFGNGYAVVMTAPYGAFSSNAKCALIGPKGEVLCKPSYAEIRPLKTAKGTYFAYKTAGGLWGVLNSAGKEEIPAFADEIISYDGSVAVANKNGDKLCFNRSGIPLLPKGYEVDGQVIKNKATGKYGVMSAKGTIRVYPEFDKVIKVTKGYAIVSKDGKYGIVNY